MATSATLRHFEGSKSTFHTPPLAGLPGDPAATREKAKSTSCSLQGRFLSIFKAPGVHAADLMQDAAEEARGERV